jgi:hypothetical protein
VDDIGAIETTATNSFFAGDSVRSFPGPMNPAGKGLSSDSSEATIIESVSMA